MQMRDCSFITFMTAVSSSLSAPTHAWMKSRNGSEITCFSSASWMLSVTRAPLFVSPFLSRNFSSGNSILSRYTAFFAAFFSVSRISFGCTYTSFTKDSSSLSAIPKNSYSRCFSPSATMSITSASVPVMYSLSTSSLNKVCSLK